MPPRQSASRAIPVIAAVLAVGYVAAALLGPHLLPLIIAAAAVAASSLVVTRRREKGLGASLLAIALWLTGGFAGAWLLRARPVAGAGWVVIVLFVVALPLVPYLYARTFGAEDGGREDGP